MVETNKPITNIGSSQVGSVLNSAADSINAFVKRLVLSIIGILLLTLIILVLARCPNIFCLPCKKLHLCTTPPFCPVNPKRKKSKSKVVKFDLKNVKFEDYEKDSLEPEQINEEIQPESLTLNKRELGKTLSEDSISIAVNKLQK